MTTKLITSRKNTFAIISIALLMMTIDGTIVATALHALEVDLKSPLNWTAWTITAYALGFVIMLPISGALSEKIGKKKTFMFSISLFTLASLFCAMATNIYFLILMRALQAIGGAGITPSATGIVVDYFGDKRDKYVSLFGSIFPVGAMIGPIFGGYFVTYLSWRWVFLVNLPIGLLLLYLAYQFIPQDPKLKFERTHFDIKGMGALSFTLLFSMIYFARLGDGENFSDSIYFLFISFLSLLYFIRHVGHDPSPFIKPKFIWGEGFGIINFLNTILSGIPYGALSLLPIYAINRYGISELEASTILIFQGIAAVIMAVTGSLLIRKTGYRLPMFIGGSFTSLGLILLFMMPHFGISPYYWLGFSTFFIGFGTGILNPASRNAGLQLAPKNASILAAFRSMCMQTGSITMISVASAFIASSSDRGITQAFIFLIIAIVQILILPLVRFVPEHKGAW